MWRNRKMFYQEKKVTAQIGKSEKKIINCIHLYSDYSKIANK